MNPYKEEARKNIITAFRQTASWTILDEVFEEAYEAGLAQAQEEIATWKRRAEQARERLHEVVNSRHPVTETHYPAGAWEVARLETSRNRGAKESPEQAAHELLEELWRAGYEVTLRANGPFGQCYRCGAELVVVDMDCGPQGEDLPVVECPKGCPPRREI